MTSKYNSPFSIGKRQTLFLDVNDPRIKGYKAGISAAKAGAEIVVVNSQGGALLGSSFSASPKILPKTPPKAPTGKTPGEITNLSAEWQEIEGYPALVFSFEIDLTLPDNDTVDSFEYTLSDGTTVTPSISYTKLNTTSASQQIIFYYSDNTKYFGIFQTTFAEFKVRAHDKSGLLGPEATLTDIPVYTPDLCTPIITVTSIPMGYSVTLTDVCTKPYEFLSVEEVVSNAGTAPTTGYQQVYLSNIKPANILTPTTAARWVKARYTSASGLYGSYSNAVKVNPTNPISADLTPPNEVTAVSAVWSGDNIVVSYTLPEEDAGVRFKIILTAPNTSVGYFYFFPVSGTLNQTAIISKDDLFLQFGSHYSSFTGLIKSIDASDNQSAGVAFTVPVRTCTLTGVTPTFTTTALVNGYSVSYTLPASAVYAEVYQKYTSWSGVTPIDSFTGSYASGGASGSNTVTLSNIVSNKGVTVAPLVGYRVIGTGIPNNTYITAVSGSQITVNNNFTSQVSGSVTGYAVVYSGTSPANISSTIYENTYLLIRYYDDFDCASNYSSEQIVKPLQPVTVDLTGPANVATVAASTSGIDESGSLGFNGYIILNWTAVSDTTLRGYRIRFTTDTVDPVYSYVDYPIDQENPPTGTVSYKLTGLAIGATYDIGVATYDEYNNTSSAYTSFADVTIAGTPAMSDYITAGTAGFQFGSGIKDKTGNTNPSAQGIYLSNSNYWYLTSANSSQFKVGGASNNYINWDGAEFTVDGDITARGGSFAGNIELSTSGASIYSGNVVADNLVGSGFILNKDGLLVRKIANGVTNQVSMDTTNGAITANNGNIAEWIIHPEKIEKQNPTTQKWAGLSPTGLYAFWSGSTSAGGDTTQFAVDRTGRVFASNVQIAGGGIDIGALPTNLTSGFHVLSNGIMYATGARLNGQVIATSGEIRGNFQVIEGTFYTGTSPTETSVIINDKGLASIGANNVTLTALVNTPISSGNVPLGNQPSVGTLPNSISLFTQAALIGGWYVNDRSIRDRSQQFILDSTDKNILITGVIDVSTNFRVELGTGTNVFAAGTVINNTFTPNVYITRGGILNANGANLTGTLSVSNSTMKFGDNVNSTNDGLYISANNYWYDTGAFKVGGSSRYITWNNSSNVLTIVGNLSIGSDYINADGTFSLGGSKMVGTSSTLDFDVSSLGVRFLNMPASDDDGFAGDPTITVRPSDSRLVKGRRFIFNGTSNIPNNPTGWNSTTKTGTFTTYDGTTTEVKVGDIVMIY